MQNPIIVPIRPFASRTLRWPVQNHLGTGLKYVVRETAKTLPLYRRPVRFADYPDAVFGVTDNGDRIPVDTFGRWLFGVPGFAGQCRFLSFDENIVIEVPPVPEAEQLITEAVGILIGGHVLPTVEDRTEEQKNKILEIIKRMESNRP